MPNDFNNERKSMPNDFWARRITMCQIYLAQKTETVPNKFVTAVNKTILVNFGAINKNCTKYAFGTGDKLVSNTHLTQDIKV